MNINYSIVHILNTNIYNPLNDIKFAKEKKNEKKNPILDFLKVKYHSKKKIKKINHFTLHGSQSFFFFLRNKHTHTRERERGSNTNAHHNST